MKPRKNMSERIELDAAIQALARAVAYLKRSSEPALQMRASSLLKDLLIVKNKETANAALV